MSVTLYHNPRCSKSRATLALLEANGVQPTIIKYLDNPPSSDQILDLIQKLGKSGLDILRPQQAELAAAGIAADEQDSARIAAAIAAQPALLQRPIVIKGEKARIGRPPEAVLEIL